MSDRTRRAPLSADEIVAVAWEMSGGDADAVSLRDLGARLGVHPTAVYRHFPDKHELMCAVADRTLAGVCDVADGVADPVEALVAVLSALRGRLLSRPAAARVLAQGPTRRVNEVTLTERLLGLLRALGLPDADVARGYHAVVELTVGSAVIDQPVDALDAPGRAATYERWRADYLALDADRFPALVALAPALYRGAGEDFEFALRLLLEALARRGGRG
ncbi:TetR/AcrR family transcriptional regulator [Kineosporia sp. R_H_3]|uniref:TetR/AcrR family transcriptional regulator n=1 Tax=Kineosporia sp. R_H_3 TaxID=1961848 RepID=UPI000B4AA930|nr:TetR/AcrR family transcriptional regulator [Kineosporia sp. R_H_3]